MLKLNKVQLKRLANIFDNAGQVFLGTLVITPVLGSGDFTGIIPITIIGVCTTITCWLMSVKLEDFSL